eukprot:TRINITY_DN43181_c0_g1_i1.p1 TRINITY_DN43181_c0_g1~~TRINITY_DN43181_c0_g1_i1.p1  ORF type:complete len:656 (+),score=107.78 TRINITY_DN43181_c0_g1_i1:135-1970(+)
MAAKEVPLYDPLGDVQVLAAHFVDNYGSLGAALQQFDPDAKFDLVGFEILLKKWGVAKDVDAVRLFAYIDSDNSLQIDICELFTVLQSPVAQLIQRHEARQQADISDVCKTIASRTRKVFGSLRTYVDQQKAKGTISKDNEFSWSDFRRFATDIGLTNGNSDEIGNDLLRRVFSQIDKDNTGTVSVEELQRALEEHIVRDELVALAEDLCTEHGSIEAAFAQLSGGISGLATAVPGSSAMDPAGLVSTLRQQPVSAGNGLLPLKTALRELGTSSTKTLLEHEDTLGMIHASMQPFSIEELKRRLEVVHAEVSKAKQQKLEEEQRRAEERKKRLSKSFNWDSTHRAHDAVRNWASGLTSNRPCDPADITHDWTIAARAGRSRVQLADFVRALERQVQDQEESKLQAQEEFLKLHGDISELSANVEKKHGDQYLDQSLRHQSKALQTERLVQAVASGNVAAVERCLDLCGEGCINMVCWGGMSPLMTAAYHGREAVVEYLIMRRADVDFSDARGRTAVDHAWKRPATRELLRSHGARSAKDLKEEVERLARRALELQAEQARIAKAVKKMPSIGVLRRHVSQVATAANAALSPEAEARRDDEVLAGILQSLRR